MNMIKKREKLNNSALATHNSKMYPVSLLDPAAPQMANQLNKLYSQKRTPTAGGNFTTAGSQSKKSAQNATGGGGNKSKEKGIKYMGF